VNLLDHWKVLLNYKIREVQQGSYKLSLGPNTFVGIAEVKLHPNSSLYALSYTKHELQCLRAIEIMNADWF
jgi:hypothetical protein